ISSLIQFGKPALAASRARRTASSAVRAPLVLGKRRKRFGSIKSRMFANGSCLPETSARRSATVTSSVPLAISASRISSFDANFPVPTIRREVNSRSAIFNLEGLSAIFKTINEFLCPRECERREVRRVGLTRLTEARLQQRRFFLYEGTNRLRL